MKFSSFPLFKKIKIKEFFLGKKELGNGKFSEKNLLKFSRNFKKKKIPKKNFFKRKI